jgi:hypothetical protein
VRPLARRLALHPAECRKLPAINAVWSALVVALAALGQGIVEASAAEYCPDTQSEIQTDRPDVTNSSFVVPNGSLQAENGINLTARRASRTIDGTNTRIRLGVARCIELLADLPDYFPSVHGGGPTGFRMWPPPSKRSLDRFPAVLCCPRQPVWASPPGQAGSRVTVIILNVQFPWSREIGGGWGLSGMFTQFWFPGQRKSNAISEATFVVEREVGPTLTCSPNTLAITRTTADRAKLSTPAVPIGLPLLSKSIFIRVLD